MKKKLIKKILCVISVATITAMNTFTALAADSYAYSIGTDYGGLFGVDTSGDAENASTVFALAGYKSYYSIKPTVTYMRGQNPAGGRRIGSDVLFYSGHGNNQCVSFNYKGNGGEYATGVYYLNDFDSSTGYKYVGIGSTDMSGNKLSVFGACNTANGSDNIAKRAYDKGSKSTIGWTVTVDASSHSKWLQRFSNELANGKTVQNAAQYANGFTYTDSSVKSYKIYGNSALVVKKSATSQDDSRAIVLNQTINVDLQNNQLQELDDYLRNELDLDVDNMKVEVTKLDGSDGVVDYKIMVNECETTMGYVAIINDGIVTDFYNNTIENAVVTNAAYDITESDKEVAYQQALSEIDAYDTIVSQTGKKMYDAETGEFYFNVFTTYSIGDNCLTVESYKFEK